MALRVQQWKVHFMEQRGVGMAAWEDPLVPLRLPQLYNLRRRGQNLACVPQRSQTDVWRRNVSRPRRFFSEEKQTFSTSCLVA
jgi:hypothetical protein